MDYEIVFTSRRTLAITIRDGKVMVRAPRGMSEERITHCITSHKGWIEKHLRTSRIRAEREQINDSDIPALKAEADVYFKSTVSRFADLMGLKYGRVKITSAQRRFGSCSSSGNLCFSYRLMLYPERAREYVVVHELAHLLEMNHSPRFYRIIEKYMPDYKERKKLLR